MRYDKKNKDKKQGIWEVENVFFVIIRPNDLFGLFAPLFFKSFDHFIF